MPGGAAPISWQGTPHAASLEASTPPFTCLKLIDCLTAFRVASHQQQFSAVEPRCSHCCLKHLLETRVGFHSSFSTGISHNSLSQLCPHWKSCCVCRASNHPQLTYTILSRHLRPISSTVEKYSRYLRAKKNTLKVIKKKLSNDVPEQAHRQGTVVTQHRLV